MSSPYSQTSTKCTAFVCGVQGEGCADPCRASPGGSQPMISAGVEGQIPPYMMTYHPERWAGAQKQEFVRPAPKPLPSRYNGVSSTAANGTRLTHSARSLTHQPVVAAAASTPVNLTAHKEEINDEQSYYAQRVFPPPAFNPYHFTGLYPPYPLLRPTSGYAPLSPLESYSPTTPTGNGSFLPPQVPAFSPPTAHKSGLVRIQSPGAQTILRDKKSSAPFKVPSGKEGSLKHRILTRPEDAPPSSLDQLRETRKRISATVVSPPRSPANKTNNNNNDISAKFAKGSLIQLADGKLRNVEDMRTEDFVHSAEMSPELRLAESTVVKIAENAKTGKAAITLSYNERRAQVEVESPVDHPFFVYGQGWASCHVDKTLRSYGLDVHKLRVGDVLISLMPREHREPTPPTSTTTSAQSTINLPKEHQHLMYNIMKSRDYTVPPQSHSQPPPQIHQDAPMSPDSMRKRRWSAPDQICDDDEQQHTTRRMRVE